MVCSLPGCWQEALVSCSLESSTELLEFPHYMASRRWTLGRKTEATVPWNARVVLSTLSSWPHGGQPSSLWGGLKGVEIVWRPSCRPTARATISPAQGQITCLILTAGFLPFSAN